MMEGIFHHVKIHTTKLKYFATIKPYLSQHLGVLQFKVGRGYVKGRVQTNFMNSAEICYSAEFWVPYQRNRT